MASRDVDSVFRRSSLEDRESLFGRMMDRRGSGRKRFLLHRLIVIGRLSCGLEERTAVGVHYEKLNVSLQRTRPGEDVSGVLLLYPQYALHVIECSTEALLSVLQDLRYMEENPHSGLIQDPRILLVSHDLPSRLFQQWSSRLLSESEGRRVLEVEDSNPETLVKQTLLQLLRLGARMNTGCSDEALKDASDVIPPPAAVSRLLQMEALLSPAGYISTYHTPLHQHLDSESVWPAVEYLQNN